MPITGFDFPSVSLQQTYAETGASTVRTLSVVCVGPQYLLHGADTASAAEIDQTGTAYNPTSGLSVASLPGRTAGAELDADPKAQHLVVKNGAYRYFFEETGSNITQNANVFTFAYAVRDGNGYTASASFGTRGVKLGDPIQLSDGANSVIAEVLKISASVAGGRLDTITVASGLLAGLGAVTKVGFCEYLDETYEAGASTFAINASTGVLVIEGGLTAKLDDLSGITGSLQAGDLYIEYRERVNNYVGKLGTLESTTDIENTLGEICVDNPLALACYAAMASGNGSTVFFTGVRSNDVSGYTEALDYLDNYNNLYSVVPCTADADIIRACMTACISVSDDIESTVRRALWYGIDADAEPVLWNGTGTFVAAVEATAITVGTTTYSFSATSAGYTTWANGDADPATVYTADRSPAAGATAYSDTALGTVAGTVASATGYVAPYVTLSGNAFIDHPMQDGDVIRIEVSPYTEYAIASTDDVSKAVLSGTVTAGSDVACSLVRTKPENADLVDNLVAKREARSQSERGVCVWADDALVNGEVVPNFVLAAGAAGMRAYEPVQRPLSNLGYSYFTLANTHGFTNSQLKLIGSNGIWVVADNPDGLPVNKRQITTAVANNLNKDEESIIANADTIAMAMIRIGQNLVGCSNISPMLITSLWATIDTELTGFTINNADIYVGPQLLSYELLDVYQGTVNRDHVYADFEVEPPKPFNKFRMSMRVI